MLAKLRFEDEIESEMAKLAAEAEEERQLGHSTWREMCSTERCLRRRLMIGVMLMVFQQLSGINAVMFYAPVILNRFFSAEVSLYGNLGLNGLLFLFTIVTVFVVDRAGRVKLLLLGGVTMTAVQLGLCGVEAAVDAQPNLNTEKELGYGVVGIVLVALYVISFGYSWGGVPWGTGPHTVPYHTVHLPLGALLRAYAPRVGA